MSRRLVAAAVALVLLALVGGTAFGGVFAADTTGSGLVIEAADGPNGDYADLSNDRITLDLSDGGGVSNDAITRLDAVFVVTNDRSYAAPVWISDDSGALGFYDTETGAAVDRRDRARNLSAGESLRVGVTVDMRDSSVADVEATGGFVVETLVQDTATATDRAGSSAPSDAPDAGDSPDPSDAPDASDSPDPSDSPGGTDSGTGSGAGSATATDGSGDDGGGQPPAGGQPRSGGASTSEFSVYNTSEGATVTVREGQSSDPFTAALTDGGASYVDGEGATPTAFAADLTFDRADWRVEFTNPTAEAQSAPAVGTGEAVSYFRVDAYGVEASAFERIGVNATVPLPADTDPAAVQFYRHTDDGWRAVGTTHHGGDSFGADLGGFGEVAAVVEAGTESGGEAGSGSDSGGPSDTGGDTPTDGSGDGTAAPATAGGEGSGTADATPTAGSGTEAPDPIVTGTATAVERLEDPLAAHSGLGGATVIVFGLFSLWLGSRGRVGGNGGL